MKTTQLRYYIAPAAPPTRQPCKGDEAFLRPEVGFNPSWFADRADLDFGERWHTDAAFRLENIEKCRALLREHFPGCNIGESEEDRAPDLITGIFGTAFVPMLFGHELSYYKEKWPVHEGPMFDPANGPAEVPDVENHPAMERLMRAFDEVEKLTGDVRGFINWQGILNLAFRLRGQEIFMDLVTDPGFAADVFACLAETLIRSKRAVYQRQGASGVHYNFGNVGNCVVNMVSGEIYEEQVLPWDLKVREAFDGFALHNCAWAVDPYLDTYAKIPRLGYIDMGIKSNLAHARELFPDARRNILYTSMDLKNKSESEIRADFERIARDLGPCDLGLPDIESDVPDERILYALDLCEELSAKGATT